MLLTPHNFSIDQVRAEIERKKAKFGSAMPAETRKIIEAAERHCAELERAIRKP